jgi:prepilin-type N-terminal cleavage/methylation domain-containing protein
MIEPKRSTPRPSGVTLVELMIATAITAIIAVLATQTYVAFVRDSAMRRKVTDVQGGARFTLDHVMRELRHASLGAGTGWVWAWSSAGNPTAYPAVQVFQNIAGAGSLSLARTEQGWGDPKAGTDALLVVEAFGSERAATIGELNVATPGMPRAFNITTAKTKIRDGDQLVELTLAAGEPILIGDFREASWGVIDTVEDSATPPQINLKSDLTLPGAQVRRLPAGALVRRARARLYFVDTGDQLVRLELLVPRAPQAASEIGGGEVVATGVENLQVGCELSNGDNTVSYYTANGGGASEAAFNFGTGGGDSLVATNDPSAQNKISNLRTIVFNVVARSATPLYGSAAGDDPVPLDSVTLGDTTQKYVRRTYRLAIGVRNTALGDI